MITSQAQASVSDKSKTIQSELQIIEKVCHQQGLHFTSNRREVQEILLQMEHPMTAYEIIAVLRTKHNRTIAPPTVYRALNFLLQNGFISRIEATKSYAPTKHAEQPSMFFICEECGALGAIKNFKFEDFLVKQTASLGFKINKSAIEIKGICINCQNSVASSK